MEELMQRAKADYRGQRPGSHIDQTVDIPASRSAAVIAHAVDVQENGGMIVPA